MVFQTLLKELDAGIELMLPAAMTGLAGHENDLFGLSRLRRLGELQCGAEPSEARGENAKTCFKRMHKAKGIGNGYGLREDH